jgi:hypothetical protein
MFGGDFGRLSVKLLAKCGEILLGLTENLLIGYQLNKLKEIA